MLCVFYFDVVRKSPNLRVATTNLTMVKATSALLLLHPAVHVYGDEAKCASEESGEGGVELLLVKNVLVVAGGQTARH